MEEKEGNKKKNNNTSSNTKKKSTNSSASKTTSSKKKQTQKKKAEDKNNNKKEVVKKEANKEQKKKIEPKKEINKEQSKKEKMEEKATYNIEFQKEETSTISNRKERPKKVSVETSKKEVVKDYVTDIFDTPYAKESIKSATMKKRGKQVEETIEFTEAIKTVEIKEKMEDNKKLSKSNSNNLYIKKTNILTIICLFLLLLLSGFILFHFLTYNHKVKEKIVVKEKIKEVKIVDENYVFLGDSITEMYDLKKYYKDIKTVNSGISGNVTKDILDNMTKRVYNYNPSTVFLLIGVNDVNKGNKKEDIIQNTKDIITGILENRKLATLYVESIYPTGSKERNETIIEINKEIKEFCNKKGVTYINLYDDLVNSDGVIEGKYTKDGVHLTNEGYEIVTEKLKKYMQGYTSK